MHQMKFEYVVCCNGSVQVHATDAKLWFCLNKYDDEAHTFK